MCSTLENVARQCCSVFREHTLSHLNDVLFNNRYRKIFASIMVQTLTFVAIYSCSANSMCKSKPNMGTRRLNIVQVVSDRPNQYYIILADASIGMGPNLRG